MAQEENELEIYKRALELACDDLETANSLWSTDETYWSLQDQSKPDYFLNMAREELRDNN